MKTLLWGAVFTSALVLVSTQHPCDAYFTVNAPECIYDKICQSGGSSIQIFEDCPRDTVLLTAVATPNNNHRCSMLQLDGLDFKLIREMDAEVDNNPTDFCEPFGDGYITSFPVADVNEYNPEPMDFESPIYIDEDKAPGEITSFQFRDLDFQQTESLTITMTDGDSDMFEVRQHFDSGLMTYSVLTKKSLDFETKMYYRLEFNINGTDARLNTSSTTQVIQVFLNDVADMPPYWITMVPSKMLPECGAGESVFTVSAADRDVDIGNDIKYTIISGNEGGYFHINEITGEVTTALEIDREMLEATTFSLTIEAKEYLSDGSVAPEPNSNTQVTNVYIVDINDNTPTFNSPQYVVEIDELSGSSVTLDPDIPIYVIDMDEGTSGSFTIVTDKPDDLSVTPSQGRGNQSFILTAKWRGDDTMFDYEKTQSDIAFTLTVVEEGDPSHTSTASVTVKLVDVNDNSPVFTKNEYHASVPETEKTGFLVTTVSATDADISDNFGTPSIRYYPGCNELSVDEQTGAVTLATDNSLDFEKKTELRCEIEARDLNGNETNGRSTKTEVVITVIDVVDEQPTITQPDEKRIVENSAEDYEVTEVMAEDKDEWADIEFSINWSMTTAFFQSGSVNKELVQDWFKIGDITNDGTSYTTTVLVGSKNPDREVADEVRLAVMVKDRNTTENADQSFTTFTIWIDDVNDEKPVFSGDYANQNVKENIAGGTNIVTLYVSDPDKDDTIEMTINDDSLVTVEMNGDFTAWDLKVQPGAEIDKEAQDMIEVTVTITDSVSNSNEQKINITIVDVNDNAPEMQTCNDKAEVAEDATTGHYVTEVFATDADIEGKHGIVRYYLVNDLSVTNTPFAVDAETGKVTVLVEGDRILDREIRETWELSIKASDGCEDGEFDCTVLSSEACIITVTVTDINDNAPDDFEVQPAGDTFVVNEAMKAGEKIEKGGTVLRIRALDADEIGTMNSKLTYNVESVYLQGNQSVNLELFEAINLNDTWGDGSDYCELQATKDLTFMKGNYEILISAFDSGEPQEHGSKLYYLKIEDANDNTPVFSFGGCLKEKREITMKENVYSAGDEVKCSTDETAQHLIIMVTDNDDGENSNFDCDIDYDNSEAVATDGGEGQLRSFVFRRDNSRCKLYVEDVINREVGRRYNLSLHVKDRGDPPLESWEMLQVIVTDAFEAPPYFCLDGLCEQTIYMEENNADVTANFLEGTDTDNIDFDPDDPSTYEPVYYDIVGGDDLYFDLVGDRTINTIKLKNLPDGLDRENIGEYELYIDVTNNPNKQEDISEVIARNYTLYLKIIVQDVNDNAPYFKKSVTVASFTQNDEVNKPIATIEAFDVDLNETISYELGEFQWIDAEIIPPSPPFRLETNSENVTQLILNFKTIGFSSGYCTFPIYTYDKDKRTNSTTGKVYVITNEFQLPVTFNNDVSVTSQKTDDIEEIFTSVYGADCVVDSTVEDTDVGGKSDVYMHFIDETKNEPVPKDTIIQITSDVNVVKELRRRLGDIDLNLYAVGEETGDIDDPNTVLVLQVLLGVVALVLGSLVFLLLTAYCLRTRSLERQVKVLSTNTFGSKESDLNKAGLELEVVPGSNMFKGEGANPMYNMSEAELRNDDTSSVGSGDSVLVGVEDNPEFKNYLSSRAEAASDMDNPSFGRTIDQVSAPAGFGATNRSNPLLGLDGGVDDVDLSDALRDFELNIRRTSSNSGDSYGHDNPNFSFGN